MVAIKPIKGAYGPNSGAATEPIATPAPTEWPSLAKCNKKLRMLSIYLGWLLDVTGCAFGAGSSDCTTEIASLAVSMATSAVASGDSRRFSSADRKSLTVDAIANAAIAINPY